MKKAGKKTVSAASASRGFGMIDAISEIQQYRVMEREGESVSPDFLAMRATLAFFAAGFGGGLREGAALAILLPAAWAAWTGAVPVFGGGGDIFGKCLVFLFSCGASLFMTALVTKTLSGCRAGALAAKAAGSLAWGRAAGLAASGIAAAAAWSLLASACTPDNAALLGEAAGRIAGSPAPLSRWITIMKEPLEKSAVAQLVVSSSLGLAPFAALRLFGRKGR